MEQDAVIRLVAERELHTSRILELQAGDCTIIFELATIPAELKLRVRKDYDENFPVPPVVSHQTPIGNIARFNLEDAEYQVQLAAWHDSLTYGVLSATMGLTEQEVRELEGLIPASFMMELSSTAELINGVQSEPLADLIKEALWAPEVLAWIESYRSKGDEVKITDKPLFRQMEAMLAAGMNFKQWDELTPREKMLILNWHDYKAIREAYINWWTLSRNETAESKNPMRYTLPS